MSRKNHKMIGGRLLRTDKNFSHLKLKQVQKINAWLLEEYLRIVEVKGKLLTKSEEEHVVDVVYGKIEEAEIWIPYGEVRKYFSGKLNKWNRKYITTP